jgi:hypothetical protein
MTWFLLRIVSTTRIAVICGDYGTLPGDYGTPVPQKTPRIGNNEEDRPSTRRSGPSPDLRGLAERGALRARV